MRRPFCCSRVMFKYFRDRKSTRLNSSHSQISYAVFCLKKKTRSNGARRHSTLRLTERVYLSLHMERLTYVTLPRDHRPKHRWSLPAMGFWATVTVAPG